MSRSRHVFSLAKVSLDRWEIGFVCLSASLGIQMACVMFPCPPSNVDALHSQFPPRLSTAHPIFSRSSINSSVWALVTLSFLEVLTFGARQFKSR